MQQTTYNLFTGKELQIAELIQQRRLQLLVHSCIYYKFNYNVIDDRTWDKWAKELKQLQNDYPDISKQVIWYEAFKDWDASTGAFLPLDDEWVMKKARQFYTPKREKKVEVKKKVGKLF
jgi:hypothetical protein